MKDMENPICYPENKNPDQKIWYNFLTAICMPRIQLKMNEKVQALKRLLLLNQGWTTHF